MDKLSASEALYGFVGWLTTREEPAIMSAHHVVPADLVATFCKVNDLVEPRDGWAEHLVRPEGSGCSMGTGVFLCRCGCGCTLYMSAAADGGRRLTIDMCDKDDCTHNEGVQDALDMLATLIVDERSDDHED